MSLHGGVNVGKGLMGRLGGVGLALAYLVCFGLIWGGQVMANMTIDSPSIDMTTMGSYATTVLTALAGVWLVRKFIKTTNRS